MINLRRKRFLTQWVIVVPITGMVVTILGLGIITMLGNSSVVIKKVIPEKEEAPVAVVENVDAHFYLPVRLVIPKINVDTRIKAMGLTSDGNMEAPQTNEDVGWYKYGARPGNKGSAVIAGHLGINHEAVFGRLNLLEEGDVVFVTDDYGQKATFIVRGFRRYSYDSAVKEVFTSISGAHLNLITCDGDWSTSQNTFADRLVVFTDRLP